jgi:drug/metabolite transporter (DMT)-like permease
MSTTTVPLPSAAPTARGPGGPAIAAALVTVLLWASAFVAIRDAGAEVSAGPLSLGRLLVAAAVLGAIVAVRREALPPRADLPRLAVCGLLWFAAYSVVLNTAEQRVDAGTAAMLVNTGPILIALLAGVLLREGFPRTLLAGCAIAFAGAIVIGLATSERGVDAGWGAALCLAAAAAYAGGVVAQKPLLERTSALQVTFLACVVGGLACLPFAPGLVHDLRAASAPAVAWTVYLGAFPTALGFTTWAYALRRTTAGRMGATTYLVPPIAVVMGWVVLGEAPPALALAGGALCLAGVFVARGGHGALRRRGGALTDGGRDRGSSARPAYRAASDGS